VSFNITRCYCLVGLLHKIRDELIFNAMKGYFVSLQTSVVVTEEYNFVINSEELIGTTEYLTFYARCRINRRHNRFRLYIV